MTDRHRSSTQKEGQRGLTLDADGVAIGKATPVRRCGAMIPARLRSKR